MERNPFDHSETSDPPEEADEKKDGKKSSKKTGSSWIEQIKQERAERSEKEKDRSARESTPEGEKPAEPTKKELAKEFLQERAAKLEADIEQAPVDEKGALEADLAFIEAVGEKIEKPEAEAEPAVEEAYQELLTALEEVFEDEPTEEEMAMSPDDDSSLPPKTLPPVPTPTRPNQKPTATPPRNAATKRQPPIQPITALTPPHAQHGNFIVPPIAPANAEAHDFNQTPPQPEETRQRQPGRIRVASTVGSIIGRRESGKATKNDSRPEITQQEVEIDALERQVHEKEIKIQQIVHERKETAVETPGNSYHANEHHDLKGEAIIPIHPIEEEADIPTMTPQEKVPSPQTHTPEQTPHSSKEGLPTTEKQTPRIETVSTPQLLSIAEKITVLDTTVKKLYQTNQITRKGLEAIVKAHLEHRDIGKELDKYLLGREAIHERAREFKHDPPADNSDDSSSVKDGSSYTANHSLRHKPPHQSFAVLDATQNENALNQTEKRLDSHKTEKNKPTISTAATIGILLALFLLWVLFTLL